MAFPTMMPILLLILFGELKRVLGVRLKIVN
jgi:hypothetical protein